MAGRVRGFVAAARGIDRPIFVLGSIAFVAQLGVSMMLPLLPLFAVELGVSPGELGLMVSIFAITQTIGQFGSGVLASRMSPRRQMPLGQASYAISNFLIATSASALPLIVFRGLAGLGGGLSIVAERLYIARVADRAKLAFTNGVVSAGGSAGSVLGPTIGAVLAINLRVPFIVVGCTASVAAIAAFLFLPREPAAAPTAPLATATPVVPATPADGLPAASTTAPTRRSARFDRPSWASLKPLVALSLWNLGFLAGYGAFITTFATFTTQRLGVPASAVLLVFTSFGIGSIVLGPVLARRGDRTGRRRMVALGSVLVIAFFGVALAGLPVAALYAVSIASGGGLAAATASWYALLSVATDGGRRGMSFSSVTALSNLGTVIGATVASQIWERIDLAAGLASAAVFVALGVASLALIPNDRVRD
jgi:DHA1 family multidrug resistance protein-like MFS transporter